jgi:hypothetical protein
MLKSLLALFLVFAVLLFVVQPRSGRAQTRSQQAGPSLSESPKKPKADLKEYFASELRSMKSASLTKADLKRIEKDSQTPKPKSDFSKKDKIFLALFVVLMTGLVIVLIKHPCKEKNPGDCEFIDDTTTF